MEVSSGGKHACSTPWTREDQDSVDSISMKNLLKSADLRASAAFSPWYVLGVVLRSLGRSQKKQGTERYCVNLENCRTKGFIMERNMCLDTELHGLEKSKLKYFVIGHYFFCLRTEEMKD